MFRWKTQVIKFSVREKIRQGKILRTTEWLPFIFGSVGIYHPHGSNSHRLGVVMLVLYRNGLGCPVLKVRIDPEDTILR